MLHFSKYIFTLLMGISLSVELVAQQDTLPVTNVKMEAGSFINEVRDGIEYQYFKEDVRMVHENTVMFGDSAIQMSEKLHVLGNVIIIQDDSLNIFADEMHHNSETRKARLVDNVVLENNNFKLFTNELFYDLGNKIATYQDTAIINKENSEITSRRGKYFVDSEIAYFYDQVVILVDTTLELHADSLKYEMQLDKAIFLGPTKIFKEDQDIYCEEGYYQLNEEKGYFTKNAIIKDGLETLKGDRITYSKKEGIIILEGNASFTNETDTAVANIIEINQNTNDISLLGDALYISDSTRIEGPEILYNSETKSLNIVGGGKVQDANGYLESKISSFDDDSGEGYAEGNVVWIDTIEKRRIDADYLFYNKLNASFKSYGDSINPLILQDLNGDSIYISADTILSYEDKNDSLDFNVMVAHRDVKIWMKDFQAISDSLYYSSQDSVFRLFYKPIMWADSSQYVGDTINIKLLNGTVSQIEALDHAFITQELTAKYFNQIKGKKIITEIDSNVIQKMDVLGNAETIYFMQDDDKAFIGPNKTLCKSIKFLFDDGDLTDIKFYTLTDSKLIPLLKAKQGDLLLSNFAWQEKWHPKDKSLLRIKTNRAGAMKSEVPKPTEEDKPADEFEEAIDDVLIQEELNKPKIKNED